MSHVWFSDHSICYLELGSLSPGRIRRDGSVGNAVGEVTVFLGYDWSVECAGTKVLRKDIHTREHERDVLADKIIGSTVVSAFVTELGSEIEIGLSTGITLISVSSEGEDPDWDVVFNKCRDGYLCIEDGRLQFRTGNT